MRVEYTVGRLQFEWDSRKAKDNALKHGVTFEEAATSFADRLAVSFDDVEHSNHERREALIGESRRRRLLIVSFTTRGAFTRLISARETTANEREDYEEGQIGR